MSMERVVIVVVEVGADADIRPTLEGIEDVLFVNEDNVKDFLRDEGIDSKYVSIYELSEFTELCNNIDSDAYECINFEEIFIGYVRIKY